MNETVSILIVENDKEYTQRCKNSIAKQTYSKIDTWLLSENIVSEDNKIVEISWSNLQDAFDDILAKCEGDYIFIVKSTYVLASRCIEILMEHKEKICKSTVLYSNQLELIEHPEDEFTIFAYLIPKHLLLKNNIKMQGLLCEEQIEFLLQMASHDVEFEKCSDAYIYAVDKSDAYRISKNFLVTMNRLYGKALQKCFSAKLLDYCEMQWENDIEKILFISDIYSYLCNDLAEHIKFIRTHIVPIVEKINTSECGYEKEFIALKSYLQLILQEKYREIIFRILNIDSQLMELIPVLDYESYLYCIKIFNQPNQYINNGIEYKQLNKKIEEVEIVVNKEFQGIKKVILQETKKQSAVKKAEDMYGLELIDFTLACYKEGKLGFKTIFKSLKCWIGFKIS